MESTINEAAGGYPAMQALAEAWHRRVTADPIAAHPFEHGYRADHTDRLAAYFSEALGGPPLWSELGEDDSGVLRMHACNGPHVELDEAAIACWDQAVADAGLDADPRLGQTLRDYWRWALGLMNANPDSADGIVDGLPVPKWSWDGPVAG
ncbi:globin domain-containing protein [Aestuariimicrobium ganziense]|uniref:globin domain-containing protein n=1 Tax=Aestuariimicrobium ganziense TaxID=2773677 RepID=UPI001943EB3D|nr:oxidoreductase [Aestuariimicrobium ganziense]